MAYLFYKKTAKKNLLKELTKYQRSGEGLAAVNMWCEFCKENKKRWDLVLVSPEELTKINDEFLKGALKSADFIMACETCVEEHQLTPLRDDTAGKWDGEKEAMKEIFTK
jgi:hypothetical protein